MRAKLTPEVLNTAAGQEAESILRACVHCGFCNATCPTYQVQGDERDGPRGRIYLIKSLLEGNHAGSATRRHLDRCLTCRSCETTCPSGVRYGRLLDLVRPMIETRLRRPLRERLLRALLRTVVPAPRRFGALLRCGRAVRRWLPRGLRRMVPLARPAGRLPTREHPDRLVLLPGCVQEAALPSINAAAARVFDRLGTSLVRVMPSRCCGAVSHHLGAEDEARALARANIDAWWPLIEEGAQGVVSASSGCSAMLKDYGTLLADDPAYAARARRIAALALDATEVATPDRLRSAGLAIATGQARVAFQAPCTLQHALRIRGTVERALADGGYTLCNVADGHLCCGSAGTYSLLQPVMAEELGRRKMATLTADAPSVIASANIGCLLHLDKTAPVPVRHWLELLDPEPPSDTEI